VLFKAFLGGQPLPEAFWSGDHFITENTDSIVSRVGLLLEKAVLKYPRMKIHRIVCFFDLSMLLECRLFFFVKNSSTERTCLFFVLNLTRLAWQSKKKIKRSHPETMIYLHIKMPPNSMNIYRIHIELHDTSRTQSSDQDHI
jgi:hypothetical protein